jgi:ABC-type Fe3+-hydroxamate transport system substrate-binding protein
MGLTSGPRRQLVLVIGLTACLATLSCDRSPSARSAGGPRKVASLVPAATDMLLGMGAGDRLVGVSNFESAPEVKNLPRVGDYQTTDWETLARLRPDVMIIQIAPDRLPPGLKQRADDLGIELVNVQIERLEDVFDNIQRLGAVAGELEKGRVAARTLRERLDAIREECASRPTVSTLIVRDENGREVIGPDTFLGDLLNVVNATNAAAGLAKRYPSIDREKLVSLRPEAVIVILPDAKPQSLAASARFWASVPEVPAVKDGRVRTITEGYALLPGPRLADIAQRMAECLRPTPPPTTRSSTTTTTPPK